MNIDLKILDSSLKHIKGKENLINYENINLEVLKEEIFAFQILIKGDMPFFCTLEKNRNIHWKGLNEKIRIDISGYEEILDMSFLGYVKNDDGSLVGDPILRDKSLFIEEGYQMIWVSLKVPKEFLKKELNLKIRAYYTKGYDKEKLIATENINIKVIDYVMKPIKEGSFYLDLWQHLSSWARAYEVEYFSNEHFKIIDNYIKELAGLGQKVINLIISDYPWAGQRCYQFEENASNLYEFNIVKVSKDKCGNIKCDFSSFDRYIDICLKHGISEEINIFGIIGNWDAFSFGNPIDDYYDPIRISYYDEKEECFDYIRSKDEFIDYLSIVFNHLVEIGLWDKVKIISDEPNNPELFKESVKLIESAIEGYKVNFKCAIHDEGFFENFGENIQGLSLNTCEAIKTIDKLSEIREKANKKGGRFTWYSCCFPEDLNIFIKSELIESRLKGWFTYYLDFDGFLRWAYAIWPTNPLKDIRFKYPRWNAGDMFFVYPGKDLKPMTSVRWENFRFGIQDFNLFKDIQNSGVSKQDIMNEMEKLLGKKEDMKYIKERKIKLIYSKEYIKYIDIRNSLIKKLLLNN
ncbi:DUF4091 domain-containing protein [Clostridium nigeriense]|uniref:DUF4091 domain-containing protein n=1 Tax=Clostridium nigeriense TaxID=1805470 RepID=UPI00082BB3E2|nr:DUF4091 domain-containing protein [Clostridium nigeriense]